MERGGRDLEQGTIHASVCMERVNKDNRNNLSGQSIVRATFELDAALQAYQRAQHPVQIKAEAPSSGRKYPDIHLDRLSKTTNTPTEMEPVMSRLLVYRVYRCTNLLAC